MEKSITFFEKHSLLSPQDARIKYGLFKEHITAKSSVHPFDDRLEFALLDSNVDSAYSARSDGNPITVSVDLDSVYDIVRVSPPWWGFVQDEQANETNHCSSEACLSMHSFQVKSSF